MSDPMLPINTNYCQCSGCDRYFGGAAGFDDHRVSGTCRDPADITKKDGTPKYRRDDRGYWRGSYQQTRTTQ